MMNNIKLFLMFILGIGLTMCGLIMIADGAGMFEYPPTHKYIYDNCINKTSVDAEREYPADWKCFNISVNYSLNNPEWGVFVIHVDGEERGHAANYMIVNDRMYVHDDYWEIEYEFVDWENLPIMLYEMGDLIDAENYYFKINVREVEEKEIEF